ncbi:hypothetical protein NQ314_001927 [Rhamnusium bicolor]|uniref:HTH psq-type domain-containing protein n=1 Tax=Rhamnusium bicolor TaxID=1586634 RepID=A0AAV8ZSV9_9CUCU|nr:hypothetical protein NQ314_001927 [Rhamnusium bicolor]
MYIKTKISIHYLDICFCFLFGIDIYKKSEICGVNWATMPWTYKPPIGGKRNCQYTEEALQRALSEYRMKKHLQRKISEKYNIQRSTLKRKIENTYPLKYGRQTVLKEGEGKKIYESLILCAIWGFP